MKYYKYYDSQPQTFTDPANSYQVSRDHWALRQQQKTIVPEVPWILFLPLMLTNSTHMVIINPIIIPQCNGQQPKVFCTALGSKLWLRFVGFLLHLSRSVQQGDS